MEARGQCIPTPAWDKGEEGEEGPGEPRSSALRVLVAATNGSSRPLTLRAPMQLRVPANKVQPVRPEMC